MSDQLDPEKYIIVNKEQKRNLIIVLVLMIVLLLPLVGGFYYKFAINRPAQSQKEADFEIKSGESISEISKSLYSRGVINSEFLFMLYVYLNHLDNNIQAGVYNIQAGTSVVELASKLQRGKNDLKITFLEGWRTEQFALYASKAFSNVDYIKFMSLAKSSEGYLFPDTYFFNADVGEEELVNSLTDNFDNKTKTLLREENLLKIGMTKDEVVILASIIERETFSDDEKPIIAGILIKRWKNKQPLGVDATVQYIVATADCKYTLVVVCPTQAQADKVDWWPKNLSEAELDIDSPYNTRKNVGLPPAPISNPGLSSINAVFNYIATDYNYYMHGKDGVVHFAKTLDEHNLNVSKYL